MKTLPQFSELWSLPEKNFLKSCCSTTHVSENPSADGRRDFRQKDVDCLFLSQHVHVQTNHDDIRANPRNVTLTQQTTHREKGHRGGARGLDNPSRREISAQATSGRVTDDGIQPESPSSVVQVFGGEAITCALRYPTDTMSPTLGRRRRRRSRRMTSHSSTAS